MGRPKLEKPTTSKERMQKYRKDEAKRASENRRRADARKKKNENVTLTEEELEEKRRNARERKRLSRANIDANSSRQKRIERKVKDKNRKVRSRNQQNLSPPLHCTNSTSRVRSHRERLKVKIGTLCGGVSKTGRRKVAAAKKSMTAVLKALSPGERNSVLDVSLTPKTK